MKSQLSFVFFLLFFISGCTDRNDPFEGRWVGPFPDPVQLEGTPILEERLGVLYATLVDTFIVGVTQQDPFFHVYDKTQNYLASFGNSGRGPGEFTIPPLISDLKVEAGTTKILVVNQMTKQLLIIDIISSIAEGDLIVEQTLELPKKLWFLRGISFTGDGGFTGVYDDRDQQRSDGQTGGFYYYPSRIDSLQTFQLINLTFNDPDLTDMSSVINLNSRAVGVSPDRSKMVTVLVHTPKMELFELEAITPTRYLLDPNPPDDVFRLEEYQDGEVTEYYKYMEVTNESVYLLYSGYKKNEEKKEQYLRIMDWQGNPKAQYLIPERYNLSSFDVDEEHKILYGSSYSNDSIYKFEFDNSFTDDQTD